VLKLAPEHVPSLTLAGMAALNTGALAQAESHLRKAVFNAPDVVAPKRLLALTHLRMGKTDLALAEVGELLKSNEDPGIFALAGEAHLASGDVADGIEPYPAFHFVHFTVGIAGMIQVGAQALAVDDGLAIFQTI
jgi:hypothetical protein